MRKKQIFKVAGFLIVLSFILWKINSVFVQPATVGTNSRYRAFYKEEPENTWDGVLLGSSVVDRGWAAPLAWHEHGLAMYAMSTDSLPLPFVTNVIEEIRKKQDVKFFIIDLRGLRTSKLELQEFKIRRLTDNMKFSKNKINVLNKSFDYVEKYNKDKSFLDDKLSFYIPFIKYHSRWNQLEQQDFMIPETKMKGVYEQAAFGIRKIKRPVVSNKIGELNQLQKDIMTEILEYGKKNDLHYLFMLMPAPMSVNAQGEINAAFEMAREYGQDVLNFNDERLYNELGMEFDSDYYNSMHLNSKGARKVTEYLGNYIAENYDFKDKRGQAEYKSWDEAYELYEQYYETGWAKVKAEGKY